MIGVIYRSTTRKARPHAADLAEVLDRILDRGIVVDIWARASIVGLELVTIEARVVAASIDTFLHSAQAISQVEITTETGELEDIRGLEIETSARPPAHARPLQ